jgi:photosystem II CP47 chlorophyll apoprotein
MVRGDGLVIGWLGHPVFRLADNTQVYARRMPSFFETFPTLFVDATGVVRADQPFLRAEAKYAIEGVGLHVTILGGALAGIELMDQVQLLQLLEQPNLVSFLTSTARVLKQTVFRSSVRGWFTFAHLCFALLFLFGHWWHAARTLYRDLLLGWKLMQPHWLSSGCSERLGTLRPHGVNLTDLWILALSVVLAMGVTNAKTRPSPGVTRSPSRSPARCGNLKS